MSSMTYIFGGGPINPAQVSFNKFIDFTTPLQLEWPSSFVDTTNTEANFMLFGTEMAGSSVYLGDATQVGVGTQMIVYNIGSEHIQFFDFGGENALFTLADGIAVFSVLKDNSTKQGEWLNFVFGAGTSNASAEELAGYGLIALPVPSHVDTLNTQYSFNAAAADVTPDATYRASLILCEGACKNINLSSNMIDGYFFILYNNSSNIIVIKPPAGGTINASTSPLNFIPGRSCFVACDGSNHYYTIGLESAVEQTVSLTTVSVTGQSTIDLSPTQLSNNIIVFTGSLSAPCTVYFGGATNDTWIVHNKTTGAGALSVQMGITSAPSGLIYPIAQQTSEMFYSNASDFSLYAVTPIYPMNGSYGVPYISSPSTGYPIYAGNTISNYLSLSDTDAVTILSSPSGVSTTILESSFTTSLTVPIYVQIQLSLGIPTSTEDADMISLSIQVNGASNTLQSDRPLIVLNQKQFGSTNGLLNFSFTVTDQIAGHVAPSYNYSIIATVISSTSSPCYLNRNVSDTVSGVSYMNSIQYVGSST